MQKGHHTWKFWFIKVLIETENFALAIMMKKWKNGSNSPKMHPKGKLPITDRIHTQILGLQFFQGLMEMEKLH